jgi:hypothetical protein
MSDNFLVLIPVQPEYVPTLESQSTATELLRSLTVPDTSISTRTTPDIQFVDAGSNFEGVSCPMCHHPIDLDWWSLAMDNAAALQFASLETITPCCRAKVSLNDLVYDWPQGFSRFEIRAMNPGISVLGSDSLHQLEVILGCPLRVIWCHL